MFKKGEKAMDRQGWDISVRLRRIFMLTLTFIVAISSVILTGCGGVTVSVALAPLSILGSNASFDDQASSEPSSSDPASSPSPSDNPAPSPSPSDNPAPSPSSTATNNTDTSANKLLSLDDINKEFAQYGSMTIAGMKPEDYDAAHSIEWAVLNTAGKPQNLSVNLSNLMNYSAYEKYILNLDKYNGVEVSVIGKSGQGRNMYMVKVALGGEENKPIIMLSGSVHAREFGGVEYITKILNDTIKKAQTNSATRKLLQKVVIIAVPLVNPDGREMIINGGNPNRKSDSNGVDLNRAMPAVNAGQLATGVKEIDDFSITPGLDFFAGNNLGTESETQALIKWYDYYVPKASVYIDFHQQGGSLRYNKYFVTSESDSLSKAFAKNLNAMMKKGYKPVPESDGYGLNGDGGTLTDYARSIAEGFKYSYSYGRMVLDENGTETPLLVFRDLDNARQYYNPVNKKLRVVTFEIGRNPDYLGMDARARILRKREFTKYGWSNFLPGLIRNVLAFK